MRFVQNPTILPIGDSSRPGSIAVRLPSPRGDLISTDRIRSTKVEVIANMAARIGLARTNKAPKHNVWQVWAKSCSSLIVDTLRLKKFESDSTRTN